MSAERIAPDIPYSHDILLLSAMRIENPIMSNAMKIIKIMASTHLLLCIIFHLIILFVEFISAIGSL